jgi:hypothetical protein
MSVAGQAGFQVFVLRDGDEPKLIFQSDRLASGRVLSHSGGIA